MTSTLNKIEALARKVADEQLQPNNEEKGINGHSRIEALKVLTPYYAALRKDRSESSDDGATMHELAKAMRESDGEPTEIRGNRGRIL